MTLGREPQARVVPIERPVSLKDAAYREIKNQLVSGRLEHDTFYSAQHFAAMLGVSRTPVREALLQLASEGFLDCLEARGFKIRRFSEREIYDVFETRQIIETFVVRHLLGKLTDDDLRELKRNLRELAAHAEKGNAHGFLETDKEFHMALVRRTGNQMLVSIMETIRNHIALFGLEALSHRGRFQEVIREHRAILNALGRKDRGRALQAVRHHLAATQDCLLAKDRPAPR
jgi:DNA-binding GntR family transcriptional regulator